MAERAKMRAVVREAEEIARRDAEFEPTDFGDDGGLLHGRWERLAEEGQDCQIQWLVWRVDGWHET